MRAAYDTLDDETRAEVEDLVCEHSLLYSRGSLGFTELTPEERARCSRRCASGWCARIPVTGRKSLYLSSHIGGIVGWPVPEARAFIRDLTEHATQRELRLCARVAAVRPRHLGQPPDHASGAPLRRYQAARHAPHHGRGRPS